ncbi:MAG TPA: hypothetical protein VKM93_23030 [Terriglobia bacterium]|nr:hypothetical protein [Terriglobia bacterium]
MSEQARTSDALQSSIDSRQLFPTAAASGVTREGYNGVCGHPMLAGEVTYVFCSEPSS